MKVPLIGVTTSRTLNPNGLPHIGVIEAYVNALSLTGACPLLIPPGLSGVTLNELVPRLDGVLFSGGGDVQPEQYASKPHPRVNFADEARDRLEIQLLQDVLKRKTPFFGICRGLQGNLAMRALFRAFIRAATRDAK